MSRELCVKSCPSQSGERIKIHGYIVIWRVIGQGDRFSLDRKVPFSHSWDIVSLTQAGTSKRLDILAGVVDRFREMIFIFEFSLSYFSLFLMKQQNCLTFLFNFDIFVFILLDGLLHFLFLFLEIMDQSIQWVWRVLTRM